MSRLLLSVLSICLLCGLTACTTIGNPYAFRLRDPNGHNVEGRIIKRGTDVSSSTIPQRHRIEVVGRNAIRLLEGGEAGIRVQDMTDGDVDFESKLSSGSVLRVVVRSTVHDDTTSTDKGLTLEVTEHHVIARVKDQAPRVVPVSITADKPFRVEFRHSGRFTDVTVACTDIGRFDVGTPSTEWLLLSNMSRGTITVIDPSFSPFVQDY